MNDGPGWIRVRHGLETAPAVVRVALRLRRSPFEIVGRLMRLWSWFAAHTEYGEVRAGDDRAGAVAWADGLLGLEGMAEALEDVFWLHIFDSGEVAVPDFERLLDEDDEEAGR